MQDTTIDIVNTPTIDLPGYLSTALHFLVIHYPTIVILTKQIVGFLIGISIPISVFLFVAIIITVERLKAIRQAESVELDAKVDMGYNDVVTSNPQINVTISQKWNKVLEHVESANENDWRQAVIEADIILGDILTQLGYKGEGIGEQLKRATKADFKTLDDAWEAHKVRNEIAHSGSEIPFNQYEARRVIQLYRKVFEEFFYI